MKVNRLGGHRLDVPPSLSDDTPLAAKGVFVKTPF
jgi:hypothetical protein